MKALRCKDNTLNLITLQLTIEEKRNGNKLQKFNNLCLQGDRSEKEHTKE